jgi:hypothetical protein
MLRHAVEALEQAEKLRQEAVGQAVKHEKCAPTCAAAAVLAKHSVPAHPVCNSACSFLVSWKVQPQAPKRAQCMPAHSMHRLEACTCYLVSCCQQTPTPAFVAVWCKSGHDLHLDTAAPGLSIS